MDINQYFYYFAVGHYAWLRGENLIDGVSLNGGFSAYTWNLLANHDIFRVDSSGQHRLLEDIDAVRRPHFGLYLKPARNEVWIYPCLLTTDPEIQWAFSGIVNSLVTNDRDFDTKECLNSDIPLCGQNWVGILRRIDGKLWLDACSSQGINMAPVVHAFCPDWGESLEEDTLIFEIGLEKEND